MTGITGIYFKLNISQWLVSCNLVSANVSRDKSLIIFTITYLIQIMISLIRRQADQRQYISSVHLTGGCCGLKAAHKIRTLCDVGSADVEVSSVGRMCIGFEKWTPPPRFCVHASLSSAHQSELNLLTANWTLFTSLHGVILQNTYIFIYVKHMWYMSVPVAARSKA